MRKVGIELEVISNYSIDFGSFTFENVKFKRQRSLHRYYGADVYIVRDGSIRTDNDYTYGYEFVTRPLDLDKPADARVIEVLCRYFDFIGANVNVSTGFHVHVEVTAQDHAKFLRNLIKFYGGYQDLLFALQPASRWFNSYAQVLPKRVVEAVRKAKSVRKIKNAWYDLLGEGDSPEYHYNSSRYYILNLHSYFLSGGKHYEIRIHSGTTNYKKIMMWVKLQLAIANYVETHKVRAKYFADKEWIHFHLLRAQFSNVLMKIGMYQDRMYFYKRFSKFNTGRKNFYHTINITQRMGV